MHRCIMSRRTREELVSVGVPVARERTPSQGVGGSRASGGHPVGATLDGDTLLTAGGRAAIRRGGQRTPKWGAKRYWIRWRHRLYLCEWAPQAGVRILAHRPTGPAGVTTNLTWIEWESYMPPRRRAAPSADQPAVPLESESVVLNDFPRLREFLTCTVYDDMTRRQPGYMTIRTRGLTFELTLYDYDSGMRLAVQGRDLDEMWATAELLVSTENAPWTPDQYLLSLLLKNSKRKK